MAAKVISEHKSISRLKIFQKKIWPFSKLKSIFTLKVFSEIKQEVQGPWRSA